MANITIKSREVNWKEVQRHYDKGHSSRATATAFSLTRGQWDAAVERGDIKCRRRRLYTDKEVFVKGPIVNGTWIKKRLLRSKLVEERCAVCGITHWQGKPLALQVDHINGDRGDNRVKNLRLLCPNCHSQTKTFGGRNIKKKYRRNPPKKFHMVESRHADL